MFSQTFKCYTFLQFFSTVIMLVGKMTVSVSSKVHGPISKNGFFYSNDASSPKKSWFQISIKSIKPFGHMTKLRISQLPIALLWLPIHSYLPNGTVFSCKIHKGVMRKIWAFFRYQNHRSFDKNLKQSDRAPLTVRYMDYIKWII